MSVETNARTLHEKHVYFDSDALVKYTLAITTQIALLSGLFLGLDKIVALANIEQVPFFVNFVFFYLLALKSRIFNPLANTRPRASTLEAKEAESKRVMPRWTPPGFIFPIVWLLIIGPIRAGASALVYETTGSYAHPALLSLMLHLSIGDVWNTINNVEKRYGTSFVAVGLVWISKAFAAYQYYQVNSLAGKLLAFPLIWLTVAAALIGATWRLNPDPETGKLDPLYPVTADGEKKKTRLIWFDASS